MCAMAQMHASTHATGLMREARPTSAYHTCLGHCNEENERKMKTSNRIVISFL